MQQGISLGLEGHAQRFARILRILSVVASSLLGIALLLAAPAEAAFPGFNGRIAFATAGIETINPNGTGRAGLTSGSPLDGSPAWSPDGTRVAFTRSNLGNSEIYVMNADGTGVTRLTDNPARDVEAAWSPDGTKIAFASDRNESQPGCGDPACNFEIYVMNADGTGQTPLTNARFADRQPAWSPDGTKIAFASDRDDTNVPSCSPCNYEIYVMNAGGTAPTRLTFNGADDESPNWSPDNTKIAFASNRDCSGFCGLPGVFVMNPDGTGQTRITTGGGIDADPVWSPDGTKMAIDARACGPTPSSGCVDYIYTINADGTGQSGALALGVAPDWQPLAAPPNSPPDCSTVAATPSVIWPPNHHFRLVALGGASDPDGDAVTLALTRVTQDEATGGSPDAALGPADNEVSLRAERDGGGDGRVYRIAFTVSDGTGGTCTGEAKVTVAHDQGAAPIDSAPSYDSLGS